MKTVNEIKTEITNRGGIMSFSSYDRKTRPLGRKTRFTLRKELLSLTDEELNVAHRLELI